MHLCTVRILQRLLNGLKQVRLQHGGPGFVTGDTARLEGWKIIREMIRHIWPKEHPSLKARVVIALGLLVGAKVIIDHYGLSRLV